MLIDTVVNNHSADSDAGYGGLGNLALLLKKSKMSERNQRKCFTTKKKHCQYSSLLEDQNPGEEVQRDETWAFFALGGLPTWEEAAEKQSLQLTDFETKSIGQENYLKLKEGEKKDGKQAPKR